jgi:predicted DNA-binding protein
MSDDLATTATRAIRMPLELRERSPAPAWYAAEHSACTVTRYLPAAIAQHADAEMPFVGQDQYIFDMSSE